MLFFYCSGYPQSCECVENDVTRKDCAKFKCLCACDVNAGVCDYGCCGDPDCSSDQVPELLYNYIVNCNRISDFSF